MNYQEAKKLARQLRKEPTKAEQMFWQNVRTRRLFGLKFTRQFLIKYRLFQSPERYFIVDFYCHHYRLIIEIDGAIHESQKEYDLYREEILKGLGLNILRFSNDLVIKDWNKVEEKIGSHLSRINNENN